MKERIDELKATLESKLATAQQCVEQMKADIESSGRKTIKEVKTGIRDAKAKLEEDKKCLETAKQRLEAKAAEVKERIGEKVSEVKDRMTGKKEHSEIKKAVAHAERTEKFAEHVLDAAVVKFTEAECAALEAVEARLEAEELIGPETQSEPSE